MGTTYAAFEDRIRRDLADTANPPLLATADLDRHIDHAARDLTVIAPVDQLITLSATPSSRAIDLSGTLAQYPIVRIIAVEWPAGQYPQQYVRFNLFGTTLTLLVEQAPSGADAVNLYTQVAVQAASSAAQSTVPPLYDDILALGASAYAAQELATRLVNTINVGGKDVWQRYDALGKQLLAEFQAGLKQLAGRTQLFARRLYSPAYPPQGLSQTEVYPPEQVYP